MSCFWCVALAHRGSGGDLAGLCKFVGIYYMGKPQGKVVATRTAAACQWPHIWQQRASGSSGNAAQRVVATAPKSLSRCFSALA